MPVATPVIPQRHPPRCGLQPAAAGVHLQRAHSRAKGSGPRGGTGSRDLLQSWGQWGGAAKTLRRLWCAPIPSGGTGGGGWGHTATVLCLRGRPVDPGLHRGRSTHRQSSRGPDAPTPAVGLTSTWQLCPTLQPGLAPPRALLLPQRSLGGPQEANGSPEGRAHPPFTGETEAQLGGVTHHGHWPGLGATRRRAGWGPWHWPGRRPRGPCAALTVRAS